MHVLKLILRYIVLFLFALGLGTLLFGFRKGLYLAMFSIGLTIVVKAVNI